MLTLQGLLCSRCRVCYAHVAGFAMLTLQGLLCSRCRVRYAHVAGFAMLTLQGSLCSPCNRSEATLTQNHSTPAFHQFLAIAPEGYAPDHRPGLYGFSLEGAVPAGKSVGGLKHLRAVAIVNFEAE